MLEEKIQTEIRGSVTLWFNTACCRAPVDFTLDVMSKCVSWKQHDIEHQDMELVQECLRVLSDSAVLKLNALGCSR